MSVSFWDDFSWNPLEGTRLTRRQTGNLEVLSILKMICILKILLAFLHTLSMRGGVIEKTMHLSKTQRAPDLVPGIPQTWSLPQGQPMDIPG